MEKEEREMTTMSCDYMEKQGMDRKVIEEEDGRHKTILGIDRKNI